MTTQEQAQELTNKFTFNTRCFSETKGWKDSLFDAKQCAIIAVNEIIAELESERVFERLDFWNEVKEEINKL